MPDRSANITFGHRSPLFWLVLLGLFWSTPTVMADQLSIDTKGIDEPRLLTNIHALVSAYRFTDNVELTPRRIRLLAKQAQQEASEALKPFGYYHATVLSELTQQEDGWLLTLNIDTGEPVTISEANIRIEGEGADQAEFQQWLKTWPLPEGSPLNQQAWETAKASVLRLAEQGGYFHAQLAEKTITLDTVLNQAQLDLVLDTRQRAVMGEVQFEQDVVKESLLMHYPRFTAGDPYQLHTIDRLREDLAQSAYFRRITINEQRDLTQNPAVVDLQVILEPRKPNTYQATLGFGTDTGVRLQLGWKKYLLSDNGDSFNLGLGTQQQDNETVVKGEYRRPRGQAAGEYWVASASYQFEKDNFNFFDTDEDESVFPAFDGNRQQTYVQLGRLKLRETPFTPLPVYETLFVNVLNESYSNNTINPDNPVQRVLLNRFPRLIELLDLTQNVVSLGARWDWPDVKGSGFDTSGHHQQAHILFADDSLGSDLSFTQFYLSSRWGLRVGERWKFLLRGEVGYTDAPVTNIRVEANNRSLDLSLTRLPELYRFQAGGDRSVRGYGFEDLSNNRNGSNHLLVASAEAEYRIANDWSVAAFYDLGNAFNDFSKKELKRGIGIGARWYSVVGPIRVDIAQALDEPGRPLRLHLTIGSPLL